MTENDILRIALIVLFLGFSLPWIFRIKTPRISSKIGTEETGEDIAQTGHSGAAKRK
jgi:hypothetical protein